MSVTKETLGLGDGTWIALLANSAAFLINMTMFRMGGENAFVAGCAGFSLGVAAISVIVDRIFLAPERRSIRILQEYLSKREEKK